MIYNGRGLDIGLDIIRLYNEGAQSLADFCVDGHFSECWRSGERGTEGGEEMDDRKKMERRRMVPLLRSKRTRNLCSRLSNRRRL
jgi:hypothetical protein